MDAKELILETLGPRAIAEAVAARAERHVPAYRQFLEKSGFTGGTFEARPVMDKPAYLLAHPFDALLGDDFNDTFAVFKSSGSSGQSFYWPQLKHSHRASAEFLRMYLEETFAVHQRRTLAVVGLALGSWIGGEHFSWVLKSMAVSSPYPFSVFSPGSAHAEIIEMCQRAEKYVDQVLLVVCPSAIGHILLRAEESGGPLPLAKIKYLVLGEPFAESVRAGLERRAGASEGENVMFSVYGSADTGSIGVESPASVALRKLLSRHESLAQAFGCASERMPHFFHFAAPDTYLELLNGELLVTRWQGVPVVRYNLHDAAQFFSWRHAREYVLQSGVATKDAALTHVIARSSAELPPLVAISGRADASLILCGTNFTETMLDAAVRNESMAALLTGVYQARLIEESGRQLLRFDLELRPQVEASSGTEDTVYHGLVQALGRQQPEFLDDWRNVYAGWDSDPRRRILRIHCRPWPEMSGELGTKIKHRGISK